jgi:hypothetical protein
MYSLGGGASKTNHKVMKALKLGVHSDHTVYLRPRYSSSRYMYRVIVANPHGTNCKVPYSKVCTPIFVGEAYSVLYGVQPQVPPSKI